MSLAAGCWFQAFDQDVADFKGYGQLTVPMLGLASPTNFPAMQEAWPLLGSDVQVKMIDRSGHFLPIEQPSDVAQSLIDFFG
jgi:pimeloyl-ACP methyl ester carboxylesterase